MLQAADKLVQAALNISAVLICQAVKVSDIDIHDSDRPIQIHTDTQIQQAAVTTPARPHRQCAHISCHMMLRHGVRSYNVTSRTCNGCRQHGMALSECAAAMGVGHSLPLARSLQLTGKPCTFVLENPASGILP